MTNYNNYACLPLVLTPKGDTGTTGATGATGAAGTAGASVVLFSNTDVATSLFTTWETLVTYTLNVDATTGQLLQNGDSYMIDVLVWMDSAGGANNRQFRITIGGAASTYFTASSNEFLNIRLIMTRISDTSVNYKAVGCTSFAAFPQVNQATVTGLSDLDSNSLVVLLEGYNPTATVGNKIHHYNSLVTFLNKT